jgi:nitroreductase
MSATSTPTLDMLPTMRDAAARIAKDAQENLAGIDVVSVSPLLVEQVLGGFQYSIVAIVPDRDGNDFTPSYVLLDIADHPFMAAVYRTALIVALEEFFGRVQIVLACAAGVGAAVMGWISILDPKRLSAMLEIPDTWRFIGYFCLGYPQAESSIPELEREGWERRRYPESFVFRR